MGRPKKWPPEMRPHKASGQERVRYEGKCFYLGPIGSVESRIAYAELLKRLDAERKTGISRPVPGKGSLTVAELLDRWHVFAAVRYGGSREAETFRWALSPMTSLFAALPAARFALPHLEQVRDRMIELGWNRRVINRCVTRVRTVWRWAEQRGLVPEGRWSALRALAPLSPTDARVKHVPPRRACEWRDFAAVCRRVSRRIRAMLLLGWFTGARPGEIRCMRAGEIDRSRDIWVYRPGSHKNAWRGQAREIPIGPRGQKVLAPWLEGKAVGDYVFPTPRRPDRPIRSTNYARAVARACEKAGVATICPYQARHAMKRRVTREVSLDAARAVLGQTSLETTNGYDHGVDARMAEDVARRMG